MEHMSSHTNFRDILASLHPNSENLRIPWFHRTLDLALWIHCFPNLLSCVIDWLRWEDLSTQYVDALCCSAYALEPGWAQIISPRWSPNPDNLRRRRLSNIVWLLCSMTSWDYMSPLFSIWGILGEFGDVGSYFHRAYSEINALHGWHRTPRAYSEIIVLGAHTQKSSYSTDGSAYRKNRKKKKKRKKQKEPAEVFFFFFFFRLKSLGIW